MNVERIFRWSALAWSALGWVLLAIEPAAPLEGFGNHRLPVVVHAFTLGVFVNGYYALQWRAWARLYGRSPPWPALALLIWVIHQCGVALMLAGFLFAGLRVALLGAHYLVPTGIVLHAVQAGLAMRRRAPGTPRHLGAHTPTLGVLIVMALGAMIILDEVTGRYGMFNPPTLLVHATAGGFLFLLPALRLAEGLAHLPPGDGSADRRLAASVLLGAVPLAAGVLTLAAGLWWGAVLAAAGLALLGAGLLPMAFLGRTDGLAILRWTWLIPALALLYAAIRALMGMTSPQAFTVANVGAVSVLWVAGLPNLLVRLPETGDPRHAGGGLLLLAAGVLILAAQAVGAAGVVQGAAALGLLGVVLLALSAERDRQPRVTPRPGPS